MSSKSLRTGRRQFLKGAAVSGGGAVLAGMAARRRWSPRRSKASRS